MPQINVNPGRVNKPGQFRSIASILTNAQIAALAGGGGGGAPAADSLLVDNGDGTFTHTPGSGAPAVTVTMGDKVVDNGDGTYTVTPAGGGTPFTFGGGADDDVTSVSVAPGSGSATLMPTFNVSLVEGGATIMSADFSLPVFVTGVGMPSTAPAAGDGPWYFDTTNQVLYFFDGTMWNDVSQISDGVTTAAGPPAGPPAGGNWYYDTSTMIMHWYDGTNWVNVTEADDDVTAVNVAAGASDTPLTPTITVSAVEDGNTITSTEYALPAHQIGTAAPTAPPTAGQSPFFWDGTIFYFWDGSAWNDVSQISAGGSDDDVSAVAVALGATSSVNMPTIKVDVTESGNVVSSAELALPAPTIGTAPPTAAPTTSPWEWDDTNGVMYFWDGTTWNDVSQISAPGGGGGTVTARNGLSLDTGGEIELGDETVAGAPLMHPTYVEQGGHFFSLSANLDATGSAGSTDGVVLGGDGHRIEDSPKSTIFGGESNFIARGEQNTISASIACSIEDSLFSSIVATGGARIEATAGGTCTVNGYYAGYGTITDSTTIFGAGGQVNAVEAINSAGIGGTQISFDNSNQCVAMGGQFMWFTGASTPQMKHSAIIASNRGFMDNVSTRSTSTVNHAVIAGGDSAWIHGGHAFLLGVKETHADGDISGAIAADFSNVIHDNAVIINALGVETAKDFTIVSGYTPGGGSPTASTASRTLEFDVIAGDLDIAGVVNAGMAFPGFGEYMGNPDGIDQGYLVTSDDGLNCRFAKPGEPFMGVTRSELALSAGGKVSPDNMKYEVDSFGSRIFENQVIENPKIQRIKQKISEKNEAVEKAKSSKEKLQGIPLRNFRLDQEELEFLEKDLANQPETVEAYGPRSNPIFDSALSEAEQEITIGVEMVGRCFVRVDSTVAEGDHLVSGDGGVGTKSPMPMGWRVLSIKDGIAYVDATKNASDVVAALSK